MTKEDRVMCRLEDDELKKLRRKSALEDEGNMSFTMRKAIRAYLNLDNKK